MDMDRAQHIDRILTLDADIRNVSQALREACRCERCSGRGRMREYDWNANGTCFVCNGEGHCAPRSRKGRALHSKLSAELYAAETERATLQAALDADAEDAELPDLDSLDLGALVGSVC